jgi:flagellar motor switch protein FliN/FliY
LEDEQKLTNSLRQPNDNESPSSGKKSITKKEKASAPPKPENDYVEVGKAKFPVLDETVKGSLLDPEMFGRIPVEITVELGKTNISLKEVLDLAEGSIIELNRLAGEPLDVVINGQLVAQGEVVIIDETYGLRVTNIVKGREKY